MRGNKKCLIGQVIRATCDRTTTDLRARDPRTPFISLSAYTRAPEWQPRPDRRDTLATDLRLTCNALRPISDRPTTWARPPRVTCLARQKFAWDTIVKSDLRPIYDRAESHTRPPSDLRPTYEDLRPKDDPAASWVTRKWNWQVPRPFLTVKSNRGACRFQWRVSPSYWEYSGVTYDLLVSNIGGTYDLADQLPSNHKFGHFFGRKSVLSPSGVRCKPIIIHSLLRPRQI